MIAKCPVCRTERDILYPDKWVYKRGARYLCSYKCMRAYDAKESEKKMNRTFTDEQREKAVQIAIAGGDPFEYLRECGSKGPTGLWQQIKKRLKEEDPDTYAMLPAKYKPVKKGQKKEVVKLAEPVEAMPAEEKTEKVKPLTFDGMEITAIRHQDLGEFYYDKEYNSIDWRNQCGDEVSLNPGRWKLLLEDLPKIMKLLGVEL